MSKKKSLLTRVTAILYFLFLVFTSTVFPGDTSSSEFFSPAGKSAEVDPAEAGVIRSRQVEIDPVQLVQLEKLEESPGSSFTIHLNLFADIYLNACIRRVKRTFPHDDYYCKVDIENIPRSKAFFEIKEGMFSAYIGIPGHYYLVRPIRSGIHQIEEVNRSRFKSQLPERHEGGKRADPQEKTGFGPDQTASLPASERAALIALYNSTDGDNWSNNSGWKKSPVESDGFGAYGTENNWFGVTVTAGHVTKLELDWIGLSGSLPPEVGNFPKLYYLDLNDNILTGAIPSQLGNLTNMTDCYLDDNDLDGPIPSTIGNLTKLQYLYLHDNDLSGAIPSTIGKLTKLIKLRLDDNEFSGGIPPEFGNLSSLQYVDANESTLTGPLPSQMGNLANLEYINLGGNWLSGAIPKQMGNLTKLKDFNLSGNQLSGTIPNQIGKLGSLEYLVLSGNQLSGAIPAELGNLHNLFSLSLSYNQLSGSIPPQLGNLDNLWWLRLEYNQLSGAIPEALGNMGNLDDLDLCGNQLSGTIPAALGNLGNLSDLDLSENRLSGAIPSELGNLSSLNHLVLDANKLTGSIPSSLTHLTNLYRMDIGYNALYTDNETLRTFLNSEDRDWEETQTTAPTDVSASALSCTSIRVSWTTIIFTGCTGGYKVYYSTTPGGPWSYAESTADKSTAFYDVTGLNPGTTYYFVVKTQTDPNYWNENTVVSEYSRETSATTDMSGDQYTLTVQSAPHTGAGITVSPADKNGKGDGTTNFTRTYYSGTQVTLTAPGSHNGESFTKWTVDGVDKTGQTIKVTMKGNHTAKALYGTVEPPHIQLNRTRLNFGAVIGGSHTGSQDIFIGSSSGGLNWTASASANWIQVSPLSGTDNMTASVSVTVNGLLTGNYNGTVTITDPNADNSPVTVDIYLEVKVKSKEGPVFGSFDTPMHGANVCSSVPVTGWAVDDVEVTNVQIFRNPVGHETGMMYIGDAVFVEGARPDVVEKYPDFPKNYRAGWGYMMLTNFLPNGGNGTYVITAMATDSSGNEIPLGSKTITCDNANAVKPFGAIDTPTQGGNASGGGFINWGWVITPNPNYIPTDGSTICVWVDGVKVGQPTYNIYRSDIADLFPGYANSNGAAGYFYLDTTVHQNGVHTLQWTVTDSAGNTDGIGSRYFSIGNASPGAGCAAQNLQHTQQTVSFKTPPISKIPVDYYEPVQVTRGYKTDSLPQTVYPDEKGNITIKINPLERIEIHFRGVETDEEAAVANDYSSILNVSPLPIGSTLDQKRGVFYWQPGPGFFGEYRLEFIDKKDMSLSRKIINVKIKPGFEQDLPQGDKF